MARSKRRHKRAGWACASSLALSLAGCTALSGLQSWMRPPAPKPPPSTPVLSMAPAPAPQSQAMSPPPVPHVSTHHHGKPAHSAPTPSAPPLITSDSGPGQEDRLRAQAAIDTAQRQLQLASHSNGPQMGSARAMIASAQQAFADQDYLSARSLAQKASVLVSQSASTPVATPSP